MNQKSVLITGCSAGGIGHALAKEFHSRGLRVIATARRLESMIELEALGMTVLMLDVSEIDSIRKVRDEVALLTGEKLDILINNAGQALPVAVTDLDLTEVRALFEVNFFGPMTMVKEFMPLLLTSSDARIVQTGSIGGIIPVPFNAAYNASKAALHAFANVLRVELAPFENIKVINLVTGAVKTNIAKPMLLPNNSLYKPMEPAYLEKRTQLSQVNTTPTSEYAQHVVTEVLKSNPRAWFWTAKMSFVAWFVDTFVPINFVLPMMAKEYGLVDFASRISSSLIQVPRNKKNVLITGCSAGGIGHALAKEFHKKGHHVFASARQLDSMVELKDLGITVLELDVTEIESVREARDKISALTGGTLDILVNNAYRPKQVLPNIMPVTDMDMDTARGLFEVNLYGAITMVQQFVQLLTASGDGRVAQLGSVAGIFPMPFSAPYSASKAATHALSNTMSVELVPFKFVVLVTGGVQSNISRQMHLPDNSLYKSVEHILREKRVGVSQVGAMPTADYAERVVNELLKPKPRAWLWLGKNSLLCWLFDRFLWKTALDGMMARMFGLLELSALVKG
ncbi:NAD(P)-binding protein [Gymnopus androsaceus JB14]|uniref:NAD(P)-binding protein n=1 Tax=Gymnopus androsaceus JB14 TaxID=1447944 RepID=A0A6A4IJU2_9AGAR|nr:NAD(P)-binding protein [Gymnopus androsaceus JB14]